MSLILDALRRADAERERGQLPSLHAQTTNPLPALPTEPQPTSRWVVGLAALAALLAVLLAALVGWQGRQRGEAAVVADAASVPAPVPEVAQRLPTPPASPVRRDPVAAAPATPPAPVSANVPVTTPAMTTPPVRPPEAAPVRPAPTTPAPTTPAPTAPATPPAEATATPAVKIGGVMYADTPENRVLVINDQALHEGEPVQPGLVLERIGATSATLRWRGQKFDVTY